MSQHSQTENAEHTEPRAFKEYLHSVHAAWDLGTELLPRCIRKVTSATIAESRKLVHGEANEVYDVKTDDGIELIVRIAHREQDVFGREQWAIDRCRSLGLPVPEILDISAYKIDGHEAEVCIQTKLPGRRLVDLDPSSVEALDAARQCGEYLRRVHTIRTTGYGYIDAQGRGVYSSYAEAIAGLENLRSSLVSACDAIGTSANTMLEVFAFIQDKMPELEFTPYLIHNDFDPRHVLVEGSTVTGIIDFGEASSEDPVNDLTRFSFYDDKGPMFKALLEGYGACDLRNLQYYRLVFALYVLANNASRGFLPGAERAYRTVIRVWEKLEKN